jgi:hypothetical protein
MSHLHPCHHDHCTIETAPSYAAYVAARAAAKAAGEAQAANAGTLAQAAAALLVKCRQEKGLFVPPAMLTIK